PAGVAAAAGPAARGAGADVGGSRRPAGQPGGAVLAGGVEAVPGAAGVGGAAVAFQSGTKRFRNGRGARAGVSAAIERGAHACLLGPNGAGKSTSVRILEGALRPSAGSAALLGEAVDGPGYAAARLRTGVVPQGPGMYPDLTAGEYLRI